MTDAQRAANRRYEAKRTAAGTYKNVPVKLLRHEAEAFQQKCRERGTTANAVLRAAISAYMEGK